MDKVQARKPPPVRVHVVVPAFNVGEQLHATLAALLAQRLPIETTTTITVVDDGSDDGSIEAVKEKFTDSLRFVSLGTNHGRSHARNAGAFSGDSELLIFIDADCTAVNENCISAHVSAINKGADVSFGDYVVVGEDFWAKHQRGVRDRRLRAPLKNLSIKFTTANVAVRSDLFFCVGGFDPLFNRYGFEDRDLFLRLETQGAVMRFTPESCVRHEARLTLSGIARKMEEAGFHGSQLFRMRHPAAYRQMGISKFDFSAHRWLLPLDRLIWPLATAISQMGEACLSWKWMPFMAKSAAVKAVSGLAYMHGIAMHQRRSVIQQNQV